MEPFSSDALGEQAACGHQDLRSAKAKIKIAVLDDYQDTVRRLDCFALMQDQEVRIFNNSVRGVGQLAARLADVEALVLIQDRTRIHAQLLDRLPNLLVISQVGKLGAHVDLAACTDRGILVFDGQQTPIAIAEYTWALIMAARRRIPQYIANLKQGAWQQSGLKNSMMPPNFGLGQKLHQQTLGLLGYDGVAELLTGYAKAFGMNVVVAGDEATQTAARSKDIAVADLETLFACSDVLSLHLELNGHTRGLVTRKHLMSMKPTSLFVNIQHAGLIAENALFAALSCGRPGMAAVDVYETEPILQGYNLLWQENALCSPHVSCVERSEYELGFRLAFQNILDYLDAKLERAKNREALRAYRRGPQHRLVDEARSVEPAWSELNGAASGWDGVFA